MKRKLRKTTGILLAYLIINGGILGWIEVFHRTESRINSAQTALAQIAPEPDCIQFSLLGNETVIEISFAKNENLQMFILAAADPLLMGICSAIYEYID